MKAATERLTKAVLTARSRSQALVEAARGRRRVNPNTPLLSGHRAASLHVGQTGHRTGPRAVHGIGEEKAGTTEGCVRSGLRNLFARRRKIAELIADERENVHWPAVPGTVALPRHDLAAARCLGVLRRLLRADPVVRVPEAERLEVGASRLGEFRTAVRNPGHPSAGASDPLDERDDARYCWRLAAFDPRAPRGVFERLSVRGPLQLIGRVVERRFVDIENDGPRVG